MNYVPVRKENQVVHEDDEQYIVHDVPVSSNNDLVKEPEAEKKKSTDEPKTVLSKEDKVFEEELYQLQLQEDLANTYTDA